MTINSRPKAGSFRPEDQRDNELLYHVRRTGRRAEALNALVKYGFRREKIPGENVKRNDQKKKASMGGKTLDPEYMPMRKQSARKLPYLGGKGDNLSGTRWMGKGAIRLEKRSVEGTGKRKKSTCAQDRRLKREQQK